MKIRIKKDYWIWWGGNQMIVSGALLNIFKDFLRIKNEKTGELEFKKFKKL